MPSNDKHFHPVVANRLQSLLTTGNWQNIVLYLNSLSHAQFRTAGYLLGETLMRELPDDAFWSLAIVLVHYNAKAFLVTIIKCAVLCGVDVNHSAFSNFCDQIKDNEINVQKTLVHLLPHLSSPQQVKSLFRMLGVDDGKERITYLAHVNTMASAYVFFQALRYLEHDRAFLKHTIYFLIKRGDDFSFNLASLFRSYFGLEEVKGTFSLRLEPYQLARLTESYEAFCQVVRF